MAEKLLANTAARACVRGKFIFVGDEKFYVRGVTYGTFRPDESGEEFYNPATIEHDFALMRENGINAVRTYTVPPRWLLDTAAQYDLRVMVGLPWEQHVAFLDDDKLAQLIENRVRAAARTCANHPALLCFTIGNEIPAPIVRWHGHKRIESFLKRLYRAVKEEDPEALVTYVNYPSTEYLDLSFVDFFTFNVYLESQERLTAYLARLQNIAGDCPLVMAEIGLDSRRHGTDKQAETLDWQVRTSFASGCAGAFLFAWTDEWYRGGHDIEDWDFGLTDRAHRPKPALAKVKQAFAEIPFPKDTAFPRISVVVCSYNGAPTIRDCLEGLTQLDYPDYEVIIVDDGSTDETARIANEYTASKHPRFRVISTPNGGLSCARNVGMHAATGDIVAYTDDDARPDSHWLQYLAATFIETNHAGVGGPNIAPAGDGSIADCVANAPGGPVHVLLSDTIAEHIPGCNMAFRREALLAVGGCDPVYRAAGDDVDLCWRIQACGWTIGFSPAAFVWHHRRNSLKAYWKQQQGYGKAEALLEAKWPRKYNSFGHLTWTGRLYGKGLTERLLTNRGRIYQGTWGSGLFQSVYQPAEGFFLSLPLMPEWYLVIVVLAMLTFVGGLVWKSLLLASLPMLGFAAAAMFAQAGLSASRATFTSARRDGWAWFKLWALTACLHLAQPLARLRGRLRHGLTPWRRGGAHGLVFPIPQIATVWSERWRTADEWLHELEQLLLDRKARIKSGGDFDRWDVEVRGGIFGAVRLLTTIEEHGAGKQLFRLRLMPDFSILFAVLALPFALLSIVAAFDEAWAGSLFLGGIFIAFTLRAAHEAAAAMATFRSAIDRQAQIVDEMFMQTEPHLGSNGETTGAASTDVATTAQESLTNAEAAHAPEKATERARAAAASNNGRAGAHPSVLAGGELHSAVREVTRD